MKEIPSAVEDKRRLENEQERYIHEAMVEEGAPERNWMTTRQRHLTAIVASLIGVVLVGGFLILVSQLKAFTVDTLAALLLLFFVQWSLWLAIMMWVNHNYRKQAAEMAAKRHPEVFPEEAPAEGPGFFRD